MNMSSLVPYSLYRLDVVTFLVCSSSCTVVVVQIYTECLKIQFNVSTSAACPIHFSTICHQKIIVSVSSSYYDEEDNKNLIIITIIIVNVIRIPTAQ